MNYNEIKLQLEQTRKDFMTKRRSLVEYENELSLVQNDRNQLLNNFNKKIKLESDKALKQQEDILVADIERRINMNEKELLKKTREFEESKKQLTIEIYRERYKDEFSLSEQIKESSQMLKGAISSVVGERFQNEILLQLSSYDTTLDIKDIGVFIEKFNKLSEKITKMNRKPKVDLKELLEKLFVKVDTNDLEVTTKHVIIYSLVCIVLLFLLYKFFFPFLFIFIAGFCVFNIYKNCSVLSSVLELKSVENSIDAIETLANNKIESLLENDTKKLEVEYEAIIDDLNIISDNLNRELSSKIKELRDSFVFDSGLLKDNLDTTVKALDNKEVNISANIRGIRTDLDTLLSKIKELEVALEEAAGRLMNEYINFKKVGEGLILDPKFLVDITNSKPVFFEHKQGSCLFIYNSLEDVNDFNRLLIAQLFGKLKPFSIAITVYDKKYMGSSYNVFRTESENLFNICSTEDKINESLRQFQDVLAKRNENIKREFKDIGDYNRFMISIESLTESYMFLLMIDPESKILNTDVMKQLLLNGGDLGILPHVYLSMEDLIELGDGAVRLIKDVDNVYMLENGEILERAKDFVIEMLPKD